MTAANKATGRDEPFAVRGAVIVSDAAVCAQVDPDLWFPEKGEPSGTAKRLCLTCPLVAACRSWALDHPTEAAYGVWGGLSVRERRAARRSQHDQDGRLAS